MNYTDEDYARLYNTARVDMARTTQAEGWGAVALLVSLIVAAALLGACDGEAAQITSYAEQEAHQRHVDTLLLAGAVRRFPPTEAPIRASTLEVTVTACQQLPNRKWECDAQ